VSSEGGIVKQSELIGEKDRRETIIPLTPERCNEIGEKLRGWLKVKLHYAGMAKPMAWLDDEPDLYGDEDG
jgi:hypothetical protein